MQQHPKHLILFLIWVAVLGLIPQQSHSPAAMLVPAGMAPNLSQKNHQARVSDQVRKYYRTTPPLLCFGFSLKESAQLEDLSVATV